MPKKKVGKKKGGKKKKTGGAGSADKSNLIPGIVPGGIPLVALTPQGRSIEVAELRFAPVKSLKQRISEAGKIPTDTMRLFVQVSPSDADAKEAHPVQDIEGYKPDWKWEPEMLLTELFDDWTVEMSGLRPTNFVYVLRKFPALQPLSPFHNQQPSPCTCDGKRAANTRSATSAPSSTPSSSQRARQGCPACDGKSAVERFREQVLPKPPPPLVLRNSIAQRPGHVQRAPPKHKGPSAGGQSAAA